MKTNDILNRLLIEHDHIRKTLNLLEMQFLDLCRGKTPDFSVMRSIVVYIQEYPEQAHHPLEDAIFSILLEYEKDTKLVRKLIVDHTELEVLTRKLREPLDPFNSGIVTKNKFKRQLTKFLFRQRRHLYIEEIEIYPLMQLLLTKKDWEKIKNIIPLITDPVFGERTQNDYERLYREIESASK